MCRLLAMGPDFHPCDADSWADEVKNVVPNLGSLLKPRFVYQCGFVYTHHSIGNSYCTCCNPLKLFLSEF